MAPFQAGDIYSYDLLPYRCSPFLPLLPHRIFLSFSLSLTLSPCLLTVWSTLPLFPAIESFNSYMHLIHCGSSPACDPSAFSHHQLTCVELLPLRLDVTLTLFSGFQTLSRPPGVSPRDPPFRVILQRCRSLPLPQGTPAEVVPVRQEHTLPQTGKNAPIPLLSGKHWLARFRKATCSLNSALFRESSNPCVCVFVCVCVVFKFWTVSFYIVHYKWSMMHHKL